MDASKLTNQQLYRIIQDNKLDASIRATANNEFENRRLSIEQVIEIIAAHDKAYAAVKQEPLKIIYKLLLILIPFFWVIHSIISGYYLAKGEKRRWKDYWRFIIIGLMLWTVVFIIIARHQMIDIKF